jgi:hypothetical protein
LFMPTGLASGVYPEQGSKPSRRDWLRHSFNCILLDAAIPYLFL